VQTLGQIKSAGTDQALKERINFHFALSELHYLHQTLAQGRCPWLKYFALSGQ